MLGKRNICRCGRGLVDDFIHCGSRVKVRPLRTVHHRQEVSVMSRLEVFKRCPLHDVDEAVACIGSKGTVHLVRKISFLGAHVIVDLLEEGEEFVFAAGGNFETVDEHHG